MEKIVVLTMIFLISSVIGWIIEVIYRSIAQKRIVNPGFLQGPYLPVYGFGSLTLYLISSLPVGFGFKLAGFILATTLLELVTGLFFINNFGIRLWDYSDNRLNYRGIICPLYSFFWGLFSLIYYFFMYKPLTGILAAIASSTVLTFFLGIVCGLFFVDVYQSFDMAYRIRAVLKAAAKKRKEARLNLNIFEDRVREQLRNLKEENMITRYFRPLMKMSSDDIKKYMAKFLRK